MLMIDDFHLIKPKANGRYYLFLRSLISKNINIIIVTNESFSQKDLFDKIKIIAIEKLSDLEFNIYAYNILDLHNPHQIHEYEEAKRRKKEVSINIIHEIKEKYRAANSHNYVLRPPQ